MKISKTALIALPMLVLLGACTTTQMAPTVSAQPGHDKSAEAFQQDQKDCEQYAKGQVADQVAAAHSNDETAVGGTANATAETGDAASEPKATQADIQKQYDAAYLRCMRSKGDQVPGDEPAKDDQQAKPQALLPPVTMTLKEAQAKLDELGYAAGPADGMMGPRTRRALGRFQRDQGLTQTGDLDPATIAVLSTNHRD